MGTPEEEIGYIASEEYTSRFATPAPESRRGSQPVVESPLRNASVPASEAEAKPEPAPQAGKERDSSEKPGIIHVDDPYHPRHHPDGFAPTPVPEDQSGTPGEGDAEQAEPILAADEVRPESAFQHPVISPTFDRKPGADYYEGRSRTPSAANSGSNSRPTSIHGALLRNTSREGHEDSPTQLDDVEEYEPLFPEGDSKKVITPAERFKQRPEMLKHRFPSEDIWEDSPNSFHLEATVTTPDIPKPESASSKFEMPEQEAARKEQATAPADSYGAQLKNDHLQKPSRPDAFKQRFPSRDIWEDAPESQTLVTTIEPSEDEVKSPEVPSKPSIPPRPQRHPQQSPQPAAASASIKPVTSPTEERKPPVIPGKPKPQIPARPAKPISHGSSEGLTKVLSAGSAGSTEESKEAPAPKPKPAVPARPLGSKIAALKAGFLSDLNSRLQLGPQAPKPQEKKKEESNEAPAEKTPLSDARKGRARGPARRKPASETTTTKLPTISEVRITETWNIWQIDADGNLVVGDGDKTEKQEPVEKKEPAETAAPDASLTPDNTMAPKLAKNTAGEPVDPKPQEEPASTSTAEVTKPTPSKQPEPISPPTAEPTHDPSPVLDETTMPDSDKAHESSAVEPSVQQQDVPKTSSPGADSDIQIEAKSSSPELVSEAVENVAAFTGKKVSEGDVHIDE